MTEFHRPEIKHVIFDWSGTLFDDHRISFPATRQTVKHFSGKKITYQDYRDHFVIPVDRFYRRYDAKTPIAEIDRYYFEAFARHAHLGSVFPGVRETLRLLKKNGIGMSLFSTVRQDILEKQCQRLRLMSYFQHIQGSVFDKKKELGSFIKARRLPPARTLYIGDMAHDVEAANHCGLLSGCVLNGYHDNARLLPAKPRFVWASQQDWSAFFNKLTEKPVVKVARGTPIATVGALVVDGQGRVLVVLTHKWGFTYGIPGGKIEKGETAHAALIREMREETGLKVTPGELLLCQDCIDSDEFYVPNSHFLLLNYVATTRSTRVRLNDESLSYLWIQPEKALHLRLNEPTRRLIEAYLVS